MSRFVCVAALAAFLPLVGEAYITVDNQGEYVTVHAPFHVGSQESVDRTDLKINGDAIVGHR